ncbi:putative reverse transcriptase domain-containing protein [Tanacetum coccineum]
MASSDLALEGYIPYAHTVHAQMSEITELQSANRRRQRAISELLETDCRRREEMRELRAADHTRQQQIIQTLTAMQTLPERMSFIQVPPWPHVTQPSANRNGVDSHSLGTGVRGSERVARECTYQDFMKCKPLYFKGTEGVVELTQWFERMETVFRISNCSAENQIKFATCTLLAGALTWWNSHVMTVTHDVAYSMTWVNLKKKMTDKYCPRNEMKKLEAELWSLKVIGTDVVGNAGANLDNVVAGTFLLNDRYAYILFDTGADRSFVSTAFSSQIDITPSTLDHYYDVELADGRIIGVKCLLEN